MSAPERKGSPHAGDELEVLRYWETHDVFKKSIDQRPADRPYVFYDGPPFATGLPHYGHLVASCMKDLVPRFWTMRGYRVNRTWGWDCHGLPIENIIEKKFDLGSRKAIEDFGIAKFNDACHNTVLTYAEEWKKVIRRIGRWVDMENSYKTMDRSFMESIWWVFKQLWDQGLIYEGHKPMHICPRCETALSNMEVGQNYQDVTDISVYVSFELTSGTYAGAKLIAWTTTPWTLPGNVLLAVGAEMTYVVLKTEAGNVIMAKEAYERLVNQKESPVATQSMTVVGECTGTELAGSSYEPVFPYFKEWENAFRVVTAGFVTAEDGTGVVHIAPGFGEDDMELGKKEGVAPLMHVKMNGQFVAEVVDGLKADGFDVSGKPVKAKEDTQSMDIEILKALAARGALFWKKKYVHSYPLCWRCDTPLLNYATGSWFVRVTDMKDKLLANNDQINWVPSNMKEGRFGKWLEGVRDWAISRTRYWGTPLPIWRAEDGEVIVFGSVLELEEKVGKPVADLHKHVVDELTFTHNGKLFTRIPEVLDCWFESGSMPYAQGHYPFQNQQDFGKGFPAQFIAEGQDQTRGWFYTLHVLSTALFNSPAFKNVVVNGIVLAEDGKKMSKRLNNYPDPMEVVERYSADAVRLYLLGSPVVHAENVRFAEGEVDEVSKKFILILRNVLSFYQLYATNETVPTQAPQATHVLDRWVLARLNETLKEVTTALEAYDFARATRVLQDFVTDLSTWYVRRSRERMKEETPDAKQTVETLGYVLNTFAKMIAPFAPFLAETLYQGVSGTFAGTEERLSVHLERWPEVDQTEHDQTVLADMARTRSIVSRALERRTEAGKPVRQVLAALTVALPEGGLDPAYAEVLADEVNVKEVHFKKGEYAVELDLTLTPELLREGMIREIIRRVNGLRKEAGLTIEDRIELVLHATSAEVATALGEHKETLLEGTLASSLRTDGEMPHNGTTFRVQEQDVTVGFERV